MRRKPVTISFLGDIGLNDGYREDFKQGRKPFAPIAPFLAENDFVVGNLEVFCAGVEGENPLKIPCLKTDEDTMHYLKDLSLDLVTLAGNHVYDNLTDGFQRTISVLERMGIESIGAVMAGAPRQNFSIINVGEYKLAFLNYLHPDTHPHLPEDAPVSINMYDEERILGDILEAKKQADRVFLILHWGVDNSFFPAPWQRRAARQFIAGGADCIIGHHSHTLQGYEKFDSGVAFYSLGNFCFSDFTFGGKFYQWDRKRHLRSAVVQVKVSEDELSFETVPVVLREREVVIDTQPVNYIGRATRWLPYVSSTFGWRLYLLYLFGLYKIYFFFWGNGRKPLQRLRTINASKVRRFLRLLAGGFKRSG